MVEISSKNVLTVLAVITAVVLSLILVYFAPVIGGAIIGVTVNEVGNETLDISDAMNTFIGTAETGYIADSTSALGQVSLAIAIFAVVIILLLFGMTDVFSKLKGMVGGGNKGGPL